MTYLREGMVTLPALLSIDGSVIAYPDIVRPGYFLADPRIARQTVSESMGSSKIRADPRRPPWTLCISRSVVSILGTSSEVRMM
jgi:hypothetical protein